MLTTEQADVTPNENNAAATVRHQRLAAVVYLIFLLMLAAAIFKPWIHGTDGTRNYAYLRSVLFDHDLHFENEFQHYDRQGEYHGPLTPDSATGHISTPVGSGSAILWAPFVLLAHGAALLGPWEADGYSAPYVYAVSFGSLLYGILGLLLLYGILLRRFGIAAASVASIAILFGSPLWFYLYLHPSMSHACSFFLCTVMIWEYERWRQEPRLQHFLLAGLTCGLAMATRFNNGVFLLILGALLLRTAWNQKRPRWSYLAAAGGLLALGLIVGFGPQAIAWKILHGSFISGPRDAGADLTQTFTLWKSPHAWQILFSGRHGMFVWTPVLLLAMIGWAGLVIKGRLLDRVLLAMFLAQLWVIGSWPMWWGGASFGQRFFLNHTAGFALGLAFLWTRLQRRAWKVCLATLMALCLFWSAGIAVQYALGIISREEHVAVSELACNQFTEVPKRFAGLLQPREKGSEE